MPRSLSAFKLFGLLFALCALVAPSSVRAQVVVSLDPVSFSGGLFNYDYTITNTSMDDLIALDIAVPMGLDPSTFVLTTPGAPGDFTALYDSGLGVVTFVEGNALFTPGLPISGFGIDSPLAPGDTTFTGLFPAFGAFSGPTVGPQTVVPEPGPLAVGLALASGLALVRRRRRA